MSDTDRELLELAAKAAGINAKWYDFTGCMMRICSGQGLTRWEPHIDDGDRFRLAQACRMVLDWSGGTLEVRFWLPSDPADALGRAFDAKDFPSEAHCVVSAAAEIGKAMP